MQIREYEKRLADLEGKETEANRRHKEARKDLYRTTNKKAAKILRDYQNTAQNGDEI